MKKISSERSVASGVITITLTVFAMALTDAFMKFASSDMTLWQIYVCRSILALPVLILLAKGRSRLAVSGWVSLRSAILVAMYLAIYAAIPVLDLSVVAAALYTGPLFIVLLSAIFLNEKINRAHWGAVFLGFAGVVFVVQPQGTEFSPLTLLPVFAALLYATAAVLTRAKCASAPAQSLAVNLNLALLTCGAIVSFALWAFPIPNASSYPFLLGTWSFLDGTSIGILLIMAILIVIVTLGLAHAYQSPRPQVIATFDYSYLIFAAFWGYVFFGEVPDRTTITGICLIVFAGLLVLKADANED